MTAQWAKDGAARQIRLQDEQSGLAAILTGMGSLSHGKRAGERMRLGLMLNGPEEEHSCFADSTHNDHDYDDLRIRNLYHVPYMRVDGTPVSGPSLSEIVQAVDADLDAEMTARLDDTILALGRIKTAAEAGFVHHEMLEHGNQAGEALIMGGVNGLIARTRSIERVVAALDLDRRLRALRQHRRPLGAFPVTTPTGRAEVAARRTPGGAAPQAMGRR